MVARLRWAGAHNDVCTGTFYTAYKGLLLKSDWRSVNDTVTESHYHHFVAVTVAAYRGAV